MRVTSADGTLVIGTTEVSDVAVQGDVTAVDLYAPVVNADGLEIGRVLEVHPEPGGVHATIELHHVMLTWKDRAYHLSIDPTSPRLVPPPPLN